LTELSVRAFELMGSGPAQASVLDQGFAAHEPRPRLATIRLASVCMRARLMSGIRSSRGVYPHQHGVVCWEIRPSELSECRAMIGESELGLIGEHRAKNLRPGFDGPARILSAKLEHPPCLRGRTPLAFYQLQINRRLTPHASWEFSKKSGALREAASHAGCVRSQEEQNTLEACDPRKRSQEAGV
jgi:hypothetical protein